MKTRLLSIIMIITMLTFLNLGELAFASKSGSNDGIYTTSCISNLTDITSIDLYIQNSLVFIKTRDAALLSGYSLESNQPGNVVFSRDGNIIKEELYSSYQGDLWVEIEDTMNNLTTHVQQEKGLLIFLARENTANDLYSITDKYMTQDIYSLSDNSNIMLDALSVAASIYNRLVRQQFLETITGKYDSERYYDVLKMSINSSSNSDFVSLFKNGNKIAKQLGTLQEFQYGKMSEDELMDLYRRGEIGDWGTVIATYKSITSPVDYILKKLTGNRYSVSGLDITSQIDLYQTVSALIDCEKLYSNMITYTFSEDAYKTATKGVKLTNEEKRKGWFATFPDCYLPSAAKSGIEEIKRFSKVVKYEDLLAEVARKELGTVTIETLSSYLNSQVKNPYGILISLQKLVNEALFKKTVDLIDYMETYNYLANLQKGLPGLYKRYRECDKTAINAKYTTLLYLRLVQAAYDDCVEKGIVKPEKRNVSEIMSEAMQSVISIRDSDLEPFVPDNRINTIDIVRYSIKEGIETTDEPTLSIAPTLSETPEPEDYVISETESPSTDSNHDSAYYSDTNPVFYSDSLYVLFNNCSYQQYRDEVGTYDQKYGRRLNVFAQIDNEPIGYNGQFRLKDYSSRGFLESLLHHDWYEAYSSGVEDIISDNSVINLVLSELYGWGMIDGYYLLCDEYYRFDIFTETNYGLEVSEVIFRVGGEFDGGEWCQGKVLSRVVYSYRDEEYHPIEEADDDEYMDDPGYFLGAMTVINCDEWVSLREYPDTASERLDKIYKGTEVEAYYYDEQWCSVFYKDQFGYILSEYLGYGEDDDTYQIPSQTGDYDFPRGLVNEKEQSPGIYDRFYTKYADYQTFDGTMYSTSSVGTEDWTIATRLVSAGGAYYRVVGADEAIVAFSEADYNSSPLQSFDTGDSIYIIGWWHDWGLCICDECNEKNYVCGWVKNNNLEYIGY